MILDINISPELLKKIAENIYENECACKPEYLVWWSENEEFPSLGIGHFLWLPRDLEVPFEPSFTQFLDVCSYNEIEIPAALNEYKKGCLWENRDEYLAARSSLETEQIRDWLLKNKDIQAEFLYRRALNMLEDIIDYDPATRKMISKLLQTDTGKFVIIDYINFKGAGLNFSERYNGQGWGLLQVLLNMSDEGDTIDSFIDSAIDVLNNRIKNSPSERNEQVFFSGWTKRLRAYKEF